MKETVSQRIRRLRWDMGLSEQEFIAQTPEIIEHLAKFFGVSVEYLLHGEPESLTGETK